MEIIKNGMYVICGRPNVGKSTLTNALAGTKVAIVTHKPQTTRNRITAIRNRNLCQFVFMDTPGFHLAKTRLGEYMNDVVGSSVADVDAAILTVEPTPEVGKPEQLLIEKIKAAGVPAVLVINKMDTVPNERMLEVVTAYKEFHDFETYIPLAAITGDGVDMLLDVLEKYAQKGPALFPEGMTSDQPDRQIAAEIVREKLLLALDREIPHGTAVAVERFDEENGVLHVTVTIYCEKDSHKGIIIGKNGAMLKKVGMDARADMENAFGCKVHLETWVKVKENWRQSAARLRNFGFN